MKWQDYPPPSPIGMINSKCFRKMFIKSCQGLYDRMMWGTISEFILSHSIYVISPWCISILLKHFQKCHSTTPFPACDSALENVLLFAFDFLKSSLDTVNGRKQEIAFSGVKKSPDPQWEGLTHVSEWQSWAKKDFLLQYLAVCWNYSFGLFISISLQKEMYRRM